VKVCKSKLRVALYARVSSEKQAEANTIASQLAEVRLRIVQDGCTIQDEDCFVDDGVSGTILVRPALERLRDQVAHGVIDRLYVLAPDRLARKASYQALLIDEFARAGVEMVFLNHALGKSPEDDLLLQVQGVIAEYERAKIMERARRGKLHAARQGSVNVLVQAPFGYRYITIAEGGGQARYQVILEEAQIIRQIFAWVGQEHVSLSEVCRRLEKQRVPTRTGLSRWSSATIAALLKNPAFMGQASFGKTRVEAWRPGLRPRRGRSAMPRRPYSVTRKDTQPIAIAVPALVSEELFEAANEQLAENRRRYRQTRRGASFLLQGLLVCPSCGYAWCGQPRYPKKVLKKAERPIGTYRCSGRMAKHTEVEPRCAAKAISTEDLDAAVWRDVCQLLRQPERIEAEYERRLDNESDTSATSVSLAARIGQVKRGLARLIDAYRDGLLERAEFEPQIRQSKERLARLEAEQKALAQEESRRGELRLVIGKLEEFTQRMDQGLEEADWHTRREIIRALVKQIEVQDEQIRIVYRVNTVPFVEAPKGGNVQDCRRRADPFSDSGAARKWFPTPFWNSKERLGCSGATLFLVWARMQRPSCSGSLAIR
jgi:site-specific DNA recombinase